MEEGTEESGERTLSWDEAEELCQSFGSTRLKCPGKEKIDDPELCEACEEEKELYRAKYRKDLAEFEAQVRIDKESCEYFGIFRRGEKCECHKCKAIYECDEIRQRNIQAREKALAERGRRRASRDETVPESESANEYRKDAAKKEWREPVRDAQLPTFDELKKRSLDYIHDFHVDEGSWEEFARIEKAEKLFLSLSQYFSKIKSKTGISKEYNFSEWVYKEKPKRNERRKKVVNLFWEVYAKMWENCYTRKRTKKLTKELDLGFFDEERLYAITIPNIDKMAKEWGVSKSTVRNQINRWCESNDGPIRKLKMTKPKNEGGKQVYAMGYWNPDPGGKIHFFTKKKYRRWLREVMFEPKRKKSSEQKS